jgi:hypothetical protein
MASSRSFDRDDERMLTSSGDALGVWHAKLRRYYCSSGFRIAI